MNRDVEELLSKGMQTAREGRWEEARSVFLDVIAQDPGKFDVWLWLGAIAEDPKDSIAYLDQALLINPNSIRAQKGMEWAREKLAQVEKAETAGPVDSLLAASSAAVAEPAEEGALVEETPVSAPDALVQTIAPVEDLSLDSSTSSVYPTSPTSLESVAVSSSEEPAPADEVLSALKAEDESSSSIPVSEAPAVSFVESPASAAAGLAESEVQAPEESPSTVPEFEEELGTPVVEAVTEAAEGQAAEAQEPVAEEAQQPVYEVVQEPPSEVSELSGVVAARDADEPAPTESWESVLARLRALDEQFQAEERRSPFPDSVSDTAALDSISPVAEAAVPMASEATHEPPPATEAVEEVAAQADEEEVAVPSVHPDEDEAVAPSVQPVVSMPEESAKQPEHAAKAAEKRAVSTAAAGFVDQLVTEGKRLLDAGRAEESIPYFRQALSSNPDHVEGNEQMGAAAYQLGNLDEAITAFSAVIRLKPDMAEAHANLGFLYAEKGMADEAVAAFREAIRRNSGLIEAYQSLGEIYRAQGNVSDAVEAWSAAAQLRPDLPDIHFNLGELYAERGQASEAIWEFRLVVDRKPDDPRAHLRLGQLLHQVQRYVDAIREFRETLRCAPDSAEAHYGLASCYEEQNSIGEAIAELEKALAVKPDFLEAGERLARLRAAVSSNEQSAEAAADRDSEAKAKKSRWFIFGRDKK